jgi:FtsH-binding integral membrane protein
MFNENVSMAISHGFLLLGLIIAIPWITYAIGRAAWNGKPKTFSRFNYWLVFIAAIAVLGFVFVYAQRMSADVRTPQYMFQTLLMGLAEVLFGVAAGCFVAIFTFRRGSLVKTDAGSVTLNS